jgi:non-ribosomal peptide synthetase component F
LQRHSKLPLTAAQKDIWISSKLTKKNKENYNISIALKIAGELDVDRMLTMIQSELEVFDSFKVKFSIDGSDVFQALNENYKEELNFCNFSDCDHAESLALNLARDNARREFDLLAGHLHYIAIYKLSDVSHVLSITFHHIISDGASVSGLVQSLFDRYEAVTNIDDSSSKLKLASYLEYCKSLSTDNNLQDQAMLYWKEALKEKESKNIFRRMPFALEASSDSNLSRQSCLNVKVLAKRMKSTEFPILLAVVYLVVSRMTNVNSVNIGYPHINRKALSLRKRFGNFLITTPMNVQHNEEQTFSGLVDSIKANLLKTMKFSDVDYGQVANSIGIERSLDNPLIDIFVNYINFGVANISKEPLDVSYLDNADYELRGLGRPKFPFTFYFTKEKDQISLFIVSKKEVSNTRSQEEIALKIDYVLSSDIENILDRGLSEIPLSSVSHATHKVSSNIKTLKELFSTDNLLSQGSSIRWGNFALPAEWVEARIKFFETLIEKKSVFSSETIVISGHKTPDTPCIAIAAWRQGHRVAFIDATQPEQRKRSMLETSRCSLLIECADFRLNPDNITHGFKISVLTVKADADTNSWNGAGYIAFTSGSTGEPKCILGSESGLVEFLEWQKDEFDLESGSTFLSLTGLSFDVIYRDLFTPILAGAELVIPKKDNLTGSFVFEQINDHKVTAIHSVPSLFRSWLKAFSGCQNHTLKHLFFAGEPLDHSLISEAKKIFPSCEIVNLYGPSETTLAKSFLRIKESETDLVSVGYPIANTSFYIVKNAKVLSSNEIGEIYISSVNPSFGYIQENKLATPFVTLALDAVSIDCYPTGDMGFIDSSGQLYVLGRLDNQTKINGVRIDLSGLENITRGHPEIEDCKIIKVIEDSNERLEAYLVCDQSNFSRDDYIDHMSQHFPVSMIPNKVFYCDAMPRNLSGKIDSKALPEYCKPLLAKSTNELETSEKKSNLELESYLKSSVKELLSLTINSTEKYFDAGISSLGIIQLQDKINIDLGLALEPIVFFKYPNIRLLALFIASQTDQAISHSPNTDINKVVPAVSKRRHRTVTRRTKR